MSGNETSREAPEISVVIPTRNRPHDVELAVKSVLQSAHDSFEVVVVDQSDDDGTRPIIEEVAQGDSRLRYVRMEGTGLSRSRNEGVRQTRSPIVAFIDDDCTVEPTWLDSIIRSFEQDPGAGMLYGQVVGSRELVPALMWDQFERMQQPGPFKIWGMGANHAVRRDAFERIRGFDELMGVGAPLWAAEDFDFEYRMFLSGAAIRLDPSVVVLHHGYRDPDAWKPLARNYGSGDASFYWKYVRCWDVRVGMLMARRVARVGARLVVRSVLRRRTGNDAYDLRGFLRGVRVSAGYRIDKPTRLYARPQS